MLLMAERKTEKSANAGNRQVNLRINPTLERRLRKIGEPLGLEVADVVRRAVEEYVQRHDPQPQPAIHVSPGRR